MSVEGNKLTARETTIPVVEGDSPDEEIQVMLNQVFPFTLLFPHLSCMNSNSMYIRSTLMVYQKNINYNSLIFQYPEVSYFRKFVKILAWNCQDFGPIDTRQQLGKHINTNKPNIIFLSETKQHHNFVKNTLRNSLFYNFVSQNPVGIAGGLIVAWDKSIRLSVLYHDNNQINCEI